MDAAQDLQAALRRCTGDWADSATLPAAVYTDESVASIEAAKLFRQGWVGVGRSDRWRASGDYAAINIGEVPVVVLRDSESALQAFANTCMHRSSQIMTGEGNCARMRCPFHAWSYALDGRLVSAPSMGQTADFDRSDHGLHQFHTEERFGFAFISLEPSPPPIDAWLDGFSGLHAQWPLESMRTARRREFTVQCNWKAFAEVFNEYYHLPYVHKDSIDDRYADPEKCDDVAGAFATQFGATTGPPALLNESVDSILPTISSLDDRTAGGVRYTWIYPNIVTAMGAELMWMYEVYPDGPGRTRCAQVVAVPPEAMSEAGFEQKIDAYYERFDVAIDEDIPMLEQQYLGQRSPVASQGRFSYLEPSVARFAAWYATRLLATRP